MRNDKKYIAIIWVIKENLLVKINITLNI